MKNEVNSDEPGASRVAVVPIANLRPAKWNPRTISASQMRRLQASLERDPQLLWLRPILALPNGQIYAGNMRFEAAVGLPEQWRRQHFRADGLPAVLEDITLDQAKERALRDNAQWGEWIDVDLADMLARLEAAAVPLDILGLGPDEIERLLASDELGDVSDELFDPTPQQVAATQPGDLITLGPHRLVCGDSRDERVWQELMATTGATPVDAMWTDPPYGVDLQVDGQSAIRGDRPSEFGPLLDQVLANADRFLRAGGPVEQGATVSGGR